MSEDEIIMGLKTGGNSGELALKALVRGETARHMQRYFLHQGVAPEDTLDILQETLIRIDRHAADFRGDGTARSWLWQIARSCLADHWRRQTRPAAKDPAAEVKEAERLNVIRRAGQPIFQNGAKVMSFPYAGDPKNSSSIERGPWIGTVDDEQWSIIEETVAAPTCSVGGQSVAECVAAGFEAFAGLEPERAHALGMQIDGQSITFIADCLGRTLAATKEYLSQCRKKIKPFLEHCRDLQEA